MFKTLRTFVSRTALWIMLAPALVFVFGASLNQIVLYANHDRFPVMVNGMKLAQRQHRLEKAAAEPDADPDYVNLLLTGLQSGYLDNVHVIMSDSTHLNLLADWIDLQDATYSPGDLILYLGEWGLEYAPIAWIVVVIMRLTRKEDAVY